LNRRNHDGIMTTKTGKDNLDYLTNINYQFCNPLSTVILSELDEFKSLEDIQKYLKTFPIYEIDSKLNEKIILSSRDGYVKYILRNM